MALVLEDTQKHLYVYIYSNDHTPSHVHIFIGGRKSRSPQTIKINIGDENNLPELVLVNPHLRIPKSDIKDALILVCQYQMELLDSWKKIQSGKKVRKITRTKLSH